MKKEKTFRILFNGMVSLGIIGILVCLTAAFEQEKDHIPIPGKKGLVTVVYDGDTIKVKFDNGSQERVRLIGIDTPEMDEKREILRFYAYTAKRFSFYYLYNREVKLSYDRTLRDDYGRILAFVWLEDGILFNEFILKEGFASALLRFPFREDLRKRFIQAEKEAKASQKGIWQRRPLPVLSIRGVQDNIGKLVSVEYFCEEVEENGRFIFLHSRGNEFSALIPEESRHLFLPVHSYSGRYLLVKGFLEEYKGKPEIVLFLPIQIEIKSRKKNFLIPMMSIRTGRQANQSARGFSPARKIRLVLSSLSSSRNHARSLPDGFLLSLPSCLCFARNEIFLPEGN